jgi:hypothetical protein
MGDLYHIPHLNPLPFKKNKNKRGARGEGITKHHYFGAKTGAGDNAIICPDLPFIRELYLRREP